MSFRKRYRPSFSIRERDLDAKVVKRSRIVVKNDEPLQHETAQVELAPPVQEGSSSYAVQRMHQVDVWSELRDKLVSASVEENCLREECWTSTCIGKASTRCKDCGPQVHLCSECCIRIHREHLFHWPEYYCEISGYQPCGYMMSLPSRPHVCNSTTYARLIKVWDGKGRSHVCEVGFCGCEDECVTLVRHRLWPSTPDQPGVAFHFDLLDWWESMQLEGHVATKTFCNIVRWMNAGISKHVYGPFYKQLVQDTCDEYRHFKFLLRNIPEDSLDCPACPTSDGNVFMSMDACFGLVKKGQDSAIVPSLHGNRLFLCQEDVDNFVERYGVKSGKADTSGCSDFQAGDKVRSFASSQKLNVTAVFGSSCRHEIPVAFFDLRHGERYSYPVYMMNHLKAAVPEGAKLHVLYDVACKFSAHIKKFCPDLVDVPLAIPLFHAYGHKPYCQVKYSPKRLDTFGLVDGECMERLWSYLGKFSKISKEMTAGRRKDLLTDGLIHFREKKIDVLDSATCQRMDRALKLKQLAGEKLDELMSLCNDNGDNVTDDVIKMWRDQEYNEIVSSHPHSQKSASLTWQEKYVECLDELRASKTLMMEPHTDEEMSKLSERVKDLENYLSCLEKKNKIMSRWHVGMPEYNEARLHLITKKRVNILNNMQKKASDIQYLSSLRSKYTDGQKIATRLAKQQSAAASSLRRFLNQVNGISQDIHPTLRYSDVDKPNSPIYSQHTAPQAGPSHPSDSVRKEILDAWLVKKRATEEIAYITSEMSSIMMHFERQLKETEEKIAAHSTENTTAYQHGFHQFMLMHRKQLSMKIEQLKSNFSSFVIDGGNMNVNNDVAVSNDLADIEDFYFSDDE